MKKVLLSFAICCTLGLSANLQAQDKTTLYYYDEPWGEEGDILVGAGFNNISPNGKYAVGTDYMFLDRGFSWDADSKQIAILDDVHDKPTLAYDVDDSGTIYGAFQSEPNIYSPGYYKDGQWHALPVPADIHGLRNKSDYAPIAIAVSPNGKFIGGTVYYKKGTNGAGEFRPVLWADGELKEFKDLTFKGQGFYPNDISNDGTIISGWAETEIGDRLPAIIVNGKLKLLYEPKSEDRFVLECVASHIDSENNVTGYVVDEEGLNHGFLYNEKDGFKFISECLVSMSYNSNVQFAMSGMLGEAMIIKDGKEESVTKYFGLDNSKILMTVTGCSADGKVLVGSGLCASDMQPYNVAYVLELSKKDQELITSINQQKADFNKISVNLTKSGQLFITGTYSKVDIYNTLGGCVITDNQQGHIIDMSNLASGIYIINVCNGNETQSFKVTR